MVKYYLHITDLNGDHWLFPMKSNDPADAEIIFRRHASDQDWWASNMEFDDRWPEATILTVTDETEVDTKKPLKEMEADLVRRTKKQNEANERANYERLKKKFG